MVMEIIYLNKECNDDLKDSCVALGFFDGMHLGHQKLVEKVIEVANKKNLKKVLHICNDNDIILGHQVA